MRIRIKWQTLQLPAAHLISRLRRQLINIRRVAWGTEEKKQPVSQINSDLVELLAQKIMERLG